MANLIIKPSAGGDLKLQDEGSTDAITISTTGNTTLAGTANNLGTVTAGTLGSGLQLPAGVPFDYSILHSRNKYTLSQSGTNAGLGGFTGTLKYASEHHVLTINYTRGGVKLAEGSANADQANIRLQLLTATSGTFSNGNATNNIAVGSTASGTGAFNPNGTGDTAYIVNEDVAFTSNSGYGDGYNQPIRSYIVEDDVTGTPGVTTYSYYWWISNHGSQNSFIGGSFNSSTASAITASFWRYL